jgi:hypothetical protein
VLTKPKARILPEKVYGQARMNVKKSSSICGKFWLVVSTGFMGMDLLQ